MVKHREKQQVFSTCTLKELCPEDKQKVAKLVKQVVELGQENQRLKDAAEKASSAADDKVKQIQECNKQAVKENCSLKTKLGQAVTVLRMYHHKVQGLDAALRAMQHAATNSPDVLRNQKQQQQRQQQQQDDKDWQKEQPALVQAHDNAATADSPSTTQQNAQGRLQVLSPASVKSSPAKDSFEMEMPASAAAARLQEQAQRLSELLVQRDPASSSTHKPQDGQRFATLSTSPTGLEQHSSRPESGGSSSSNATLRLPCGHASASAQHSHSADRDVGQHRPDGSAAPCSSPEALPGMPLVLPLHGAGMHEAVHGLAAWQLQQGLITPGQAADTLQRKVLQFDPSIGSYGAFVIQEPPAVPPVGSSLAGALAAAGSLSSTQHAQHQIEQQQQALGDLSIRLGNHVSAGVGAGSGSRCSSAVPPGVLEASPWESPTCKQLMDLAAAFDSLATASTTPGSGAGSMPGSSPATVGVHGCAPIQPDMAPVAAVSAAPAGIASHVGSAAASASMAAGLPCEYGVEEVPVESLGAGQLPVVVQNEKSWNSLYGPSPQTSAAGVENSTLPMMPSSTFVPQQLVLQQQAVQNQALQPGICQEHSSSAVVQNRQYAGYANNWQQQPAQPQCMHGQMIGMQQPSCGKWQQQHHSKQSIVMQQQYQQVQPRQQPARHVLQQQPAVVHPLDDHAPLSGSSCHTDWKQTALQQQHLHLHEVGGQFMQQSMWPSHALAQQQHQHHQQPRVDQQLSQQQSHSCLQDDDIYVLQPCTQLEQYQQRVSNVGSSALSPAPTDAQQLLQRFDESLVDLLMEVERLEQQQQQLRRRRHQEHEQRQPHPSKQQSQQLQARSGQQAPHRQPALQRQLPQHDQGYQFVGQQQRLSVVQHHHVQGGGWPHSDASYIIEPEDDEISEILNC